MPKYTIAYNYNITSQVTVEADNEEEAEAMFKNIPICALEEIEEDYPGERDYYEIEEATETDPLSNFNICTLCIKYPGELH